MSKFRTQVGEVIENQDKLQQIKDLRIRNEIIKMKSEMQKHF